MLLPLSHFAVCKEEVSAACENSCTAATTITITRQPRPQKTLYVLQLDWIAD